MPYEEIYLQRLKEENPEEYKRIDKKQQRKEIQMFTTYDSVLLHATMHTKLGFSRDRGITFATNSIV